MWPEDKESARKRLRHRHTLSALVFLDVFFKTYKKEKKRKNTSVAVATIAIYLTSYFCDKCFQ